MRQRRLGSTGPLVSCLGLGGNIFGHFCDAAETRRVMDIALDHGINYVDTADVYSDGRSEELIGAAARGRRDRWFIATKAGVASMGTSRGLGRRSTIMAKIDASLARLSTDRVDLYQMHHPDPITPLEETQGALNDLVTQGKVRFVGVCNYTGAQLRRCAAVSDAEGLVRVSSVQNLYHVLKREAESDIFPACREVGVGGVMYGVLARGILAGKYTMGQTPPPESRATTSGNVRADLDPDVLSVVDKLREFAAARNRALVQLPLAWALRRPEVSTVLVGVRNEHQFLGVVPAVDWTLSSAEVADIERIVGDTSRFRHLALGSQPPRAEQYQAERGL